MNDLRAYMLIGLPGSGKSTWIKNNNKMLGNFAIISTDDFIEKRATFLGKTYSEVFSSEIKAATQQMQQDLQDAIRDKKNIIFDQTNLTVKTRRGKLSQLPKNYARIAVLFEIDENELENRLNRRGQETGKVIGQKIVDDMRSRYEPPSLSEGFQQIIKV